MSDMIFGVFASIACLLGLTLAAGALDQGMAMFGSALAAFGYLFVVFLVKRHFDVQELTAAAERG